MSIADVNHEPDAVSPLDRPSTESIEEQWITHRSQLAYGGMQP
jgi:hypothetical protein